MGSLTGNPNAIAAFTGQPFPNGLDLNRCVITHDLGIFTADPAASFQAGALVTKGANGITSALGKNVLGIAKWNKLNTLLGVNVDEPIVFTAQATDYALKKANVSNVKVSLAAGGAALVNPTDYTFAAVNGTVRSIAAGALPPGTTGYVTYTYQISNADLDFQGRNFFNFIDDVTIQAGALTVITGWTMLFTTQYDSSRQYTVGGVGGNLYAAGAVTPAKAGLLTNDITTEAAAADFVGSVIQVPTATDPYLGIVFGGSPVKF